MSLDQITRRYGWGALRALYATPASGSRPIPDPAAATVATAAAPASTGTTTQPGNTQAGSNAAATKPKDGLRSTFATLFNAVRAGDIATARSALAELPSESTTYTPAKARENGRVSARAQARADLQSLLTAVANGDQAGAQSALSALQSDFVAMAARRRHGRHHHHHRGDGAAAPSTSTPSATTSATPSTGSIQSSIVVTSFTLTINVQSVRAYASASLPAGTAAPTGQSLSATA